MVRTILIPINGSEYAIAAIDYGIYIAKKLNAKLIGLHVLDARRMQEPGCKDTSNSIGFASLQNNPPRHETEWDKCADAILKGFSDRCDAAGISSDAMKLSGIIEHTIVDQGQLTDWTLLAQRDEHSNTDTCSILGSTTEGVVRNSRKPVLVTPARYQEIESMALVYDGSPAARNALKLAAYLSEKALWPLTILCITADEAIADILHKEIEMCLDPIQIDCETIMIAGRQSLELFKFIEEGSVELIMMGVDGHQRRQDYHIGRTAFDVIRKSPIPVLVTS